MTGAPAERARGARGFGSRRAGRGGIPGREWRGRRGRPVGCLPPSQGFPGPAGPPPWQDAGLRHQVPGHRSRICPLNPQTERRNLGGAPPTLWVGPSNSFLGCERSTAEAISRKSSPRTFRFLDPARVHMTNSNQCSKSLLERGAWHWLAAATIPALAYIRPCLFFFALACVCPCRQENRQQRIRAVLCSSADAPPRACVAHARARTRVNAASRRLKSESSLCRPGLPGKLSLGGDPGRGRFTRPSVSWLKPQSLCLKAGRFKN